MKFIVYIYLILSILLIVYCTAQDYYPVDPTGRCEPYIGDPIGTPICDGLLANANSVYVNSTTTQTDLRDQALQLKLILDFSGSDACKIQDTYKTLCAFFFMECVEFKETNSSVVLAFPKYPCSKNCVNTTNLCSIPKSFVNCDATIVNGVYNYSTFPLETSYYNLTSYNGGSANYSVTCQDPYLIDSNVTYSLCPSPLLLHPTDDHAASKYQGYTYVSNTSSCVSPCPSPIFTPKTWKQIYTMGDILSFLSLFCTSFLIITYGPLNPKMTRFDKINICVMSGAFGIALAGVIQAFKGDQYLCPEPGRSASPIDDYCIATGFILHLSALYVVTWWSIMTFEIWYAIKTVGSKKNEYFFKYYCIGTSIVSLVCPIVTISARDYHAGPGNVFCWIATPKYRNAFFWGPLAVFLFAGTIFLLLLMREIYLIVSVKISKTDQSRWNILKMEIKPICSLLAYYTILLYLFSFDQYVVSSLDRFYDSIPTYFACLTNPKTVDPIAECIVQGPNAVGIGFFVFCIRIFGVFSFLLYGLTSRTRSIWRGSIVCNNRFAKIISAKLDHFTSSTGFGSSTNNHSGSTITPGGPNNINSESESGYSSGATFGMSAISVAHEMDEL
ncbi:G-protein-coupled receptor family protein [Cavenderia fasciculata]|uniref:G-protein-coupled receptor family protein n=1 Tax=Cavenderia fasciculata TaxID=261658 RepID=F4PVV9_CACFS|nr:G-protein-coupled receptor family protein [Cavenderia fasciculata]EGG20123.1 G-protein-coupled receptor family protein [Cavenderia fasciculata]|eukprot:XP_004367106.1 G-protein-coupled receptor family protein [Cavenderia fasciculata]